MGENEEMHTRTVIAIPASFDKDEKLETKTTHKYVKYLESRKAGTLMTTAGTSNFNLLTNKEIHCLNETISNNFGNSKIIGIPPLSLKDSIAFVKESKKYTDKNTFLMALYPERYYDDRTIINFMTNIRNETDNPIYIHAKPIQKATGGIWDYTSEIINEMVSSNVVKGIKEEHSELSKSYNFVANLHKSTDIIVAGGSMRRHQFLRSAGANTFLAGIGNLFPEVEQEYLEGTTEKALQKEIKLFNTFMKYGWHKSLRIALKYLDLTCYYDRQPWPIMEKCQIEEIEKTIKDIKDE